MKYVVSDLTEDMREDIRSWCYKYQYEFYNLTFQQLENILEDKCCGYDLFIAAFNLHCAGWNVNSELLDALEIEEE